MLIGVAMLHLWLFEGHGPVGRVIIGLFLAVGSFKFVGPFEEQRWMFAGTIVPITYIAWSVWLIVSGFVLLLG